MTWWLVPSILGVALIGIVLGLLVTRLILKAQKKSSPFFQKQNILTADVTTRQSFYPVTGQKEIISAEKRSVERNTVTDPLQDEKLNVYLNQRRSFTPVKSSASPVLLELETNFSIANKPVTNHLMNFKIDIWRSQRSEFNAVGSEIFGELTEAYTDMMLANNIVWLVNELGRDSQDLNESYLKLSNKIAERLQRIMPAVRNSFK